MSAQGLRLQGATILTQPAAADADAALVDLCQRFAEEEFARWYRYVAFDDEAMHGDQSADFETLQQIIETKATTPNGWKAKALALVAWDEESLSEGIADQDISSHMRRSFFLDVVGEERDAIMARLQAKYGPLPKQYTANGIFLGWEHDA